MVVFAAIPKPPPSHEPQVSALAPPSAAIGSEGAYHEPRQRPPMRVSYMSEQNIKRNHSFLARSHSKIDFTYYNTTTTL